ncbi:MAG: hypothetical protein AB3N21_15860 [Ruegeria sp.]|uniref:hypothetical protein n=1 Tax=Ruegeria sp. TaxID=1879320 RepID=UPI00349EC584
MLKSSFWFYAPLIWLASPPSGLERKPDGTFRWDPSLARTPIDIVSALVAIIGASILIFRVWDHKAYQVASTWAKANDFPVYWPLLAAGINPVGLDVWYLLPGVGAILSLTVFLWAMQISARVRLVGRYPGQFSLLCLYKLNSAKNAASALTVIIGFVFLLVYYGANCRLPTFLQFFVSIISDVDCALPDPL